MNETQLAISAAIGALKPNPVTRFREALVDELRPLITGIGIARGDLKAACEWKDGSLHVVVRDASMGIDLHASSVAIEQVFAEAVTDGLQATLDGLGLEGEA